MNTEVLHKIAAFKSACCLSDSQRKHKIGSANSASSINSHSYLAFPYSFRAFEVA